MKGLVLVIMAWLMPGSRLTLTGRGLGASHCLAGFKARLSSFLGGSMALMIFLVDDVAGMFGISVKGLSL